MQLSLPDAYQLVKRKRKIASPNWSFLRQLIAYERQLTPNSAIGNSFLIDIVRESWSLDKKEFSDADIQQGLEKANYKPNLLVGVLYP